MTRSLATSSPPSLSVAARALLGLVRGYQLVLSPFLGGHCRFEPSCSRYAAACLRDHGAWRGSLLSMLRLCKCHPFHQGGFDPPPPPARPLSLAPTSKPAPRTDSAPHSDLATDLRASSPS